MKMWICDRRSLSESSRSTCLCGGFDRHDVMACKGKAEIVILQRAATRCQRISADPKIKSLIHAEHATGEKLA